jgi:hypothetical protein
VKNRDFAEGFARVLKPGVVLMVPLQPAETEDASLLWPRERSMPRCSICSDLMVAPEACALQPCGKITYLWSCDTCGLGFVTQVSILRHVTVADHKT